MPFDFTMNPERKLPPDGSMSVVTSKAKDFKSNIMIIKVPEHLKNPNLKYNYHLAIIDRTITGTDYSGNSILDKLIPGLPPVKMPEEPAEKEDSPPPKKEVYRQRDFRRPRRVSHSNSGGRFGPPHYKKPRIERPIAVDLPPWKRGLEPWNPIPAQVQTIPSFVDSGPVNAVEYPIDYFNHIESRPLPPDYPHNSSNFVSGLPPNYPNGTGLLGHRPAYFNNAPGPSYRRHNSNPRGEPPSGNGYQDASRDGRIGYRNRNLREGAALNKPYQSERGFHKNNRKQTNSGPQRRPFPNKERNSKGAGWNAGEAPMPNIRNKLQGENSTPRGMGRNAQKGSYQRGRQNYRRSRN